MKYCQEASLVYNRCQNKKKTKPKKQKKQKKTVEQFRAHEGNPTSGEESAGKDFWKRCVLSLKWKSVGVMDGESGDDGRDELTWLE